MSNPRNEKRRTNLVLSTRTFGAVVYIKYLMKKTYQTPYFAQTFLDTEKVAQSPGDEWNVKCKQRPHFSVGKTLLKSAAQGMHSRVKTETPQVFIGDYPQKFSKLLHDAIIYRFEGAAFL